MTFNLRVSTAADGENAWPHRADRAAEAIVRAGADVVGTQELLQGMRKDLADALPDYAWIGASREAKPDGEMCAILYRKSHFAAADSGTFWLSDTPDVPGSVGWDAALPRICTWCELASRRDPKLRVIVYNTHLDHVGEEARFRGLALILRRIGERLERDAAPCILMGDFNAAPNSSAVRMLRCVGEPAVQPALQDVYASVYGTRPVGRTFHGFRGGSDGEPIDYIAVSREFTVLDAAVDRSLIRGRYPSDHYPVLANVRLPR